jgi:hypothetical protein
LPKSGLSAFAVADAPKLWQWSENHSF